MTTPPAHKRRLGYDTDAELREEGYKERRAELAVKSLVSAGLLRATRGPKRYTLEIVDTEGYSHGTSSSTATV